MVEINLGLQGKKEEPVVIEADVAEPSGTNGASYKRASRLI